jgi:phosphatidylserine/phosphatidylglycerophosphate/cardiolipin synthase-like enzyme
MKILQPHKISPEIIDIIYEAKEHLVIVSPYVNFSNWDRLATELKNALKKGVKIDFFVRNEPENSKSWEQVSELGITPRLVLNLHAKFYHNEKNGIISSMNLLSSSNSNSIEIGCKLETPEELQELRFFVRDFIETNETDCIPNEEDLYLSKEKFIYVLENYLANFIRSRTSIYFKNGQFVINTLSNNFNLVINKADNTIAINFILSGKLAEAFDSKFTQYYKSQYFKCILNRGGNGYYDTFTAFSTVRLSNSFLDNLRVNEKKELIIGISELFDCYNKFQNTCS